MKNKFLILGILVSLILSGCGGATGNSSLDNQTPPEVDVTTDVGADQNNGETGEEVHVRLLKDTDYYVSPKNTGKLQVKDGKLCDMAGNAVQLKGVSTHGIARVENFLNQELFEEMRYDWGVNVVRLAMYIQSMDGYTYSDMYKQKNNQIMRKGIDLAIANDMYVIVDWHILDDRTPLKHKDAALEFFKDISSEYKDCDNIIYEICNEPNHTEWDEIKEYANEVIPIIRANDPDSVIICGTPEWSQRVDQAYADPLDFENIMYTLHFYSASHKDKLRNRMIACVEAGFPIFVTEYGVTADSGGFPRDLEEADRWMDVLDEYDISSCIWCLAKSGDACNLIVNRTIKFSGFEEEDFSETGTWFVDMVGKYRDSITGATK